MLANKILNSVAGATEEKLYVDDVFSTHLYDGNGSTQTINNGIDLEGKGGMVWIKARSLAGSHALIDTTRGNRKILSTNVAGVNADSNIGFDLTAFNSNGFSLGPDNQGNLNTSGHAITSWTFRNAPKFFTHTTISHTNGTATNIDLSTLGTVGMVVAKITNTTGDWSTWHRSLTAGNNLCLNTTAAQTTTNAWLSVSGKTATLASAAPTGTYVIYAWAHDDSADGIIQCGSFTTDANGYATVTLGWEPQFVLTKVIDQTATWLISDSTRGFSTPWTVPQGTACVLKPNLIDAEVNPFMGSQGGAGPISTGFEFKQISAVRSFVYLAIRIPNKPPTSGTEVFQPVTYTGTNTDNRLVNTGIKTDMAWFRMRTGSGAGYEGFVVGDRLRGQGWLKTGTTQAETTTADGLDQQIVSTTEYGTAFSSMTGVWVGNNNGVNTASNINANTTANNHIAYAFQRRPGFFDIVCYTGTGANRTVPHQLGVAPELMVMKRRDITSNFSVYAEPVGAGSFLQMQDANSAAVSSAYWNDTAPTSTVFSLGTQNQVNAPGGNYVAYLFATLPGISKVGSYTGNGGTQTIDCGFTTGARFVMIKRTDSTGDWHVFDSARGIIAGDDPVLTANLTASETDLGAGDRLDVDNAGFIVNNITNRNMNLAGATFIYLAIA